MKAKGGLRLWLRMVRIRLFRCCREVWPKVTDRSLTVSNGPEAYYASGYWGRDWRTITLMGEEGK